MSEFSNTNPNREESGSIDPAFLERIVRCQDGTLNAEELAAFEAELLSNSEKLRAFADVQMQSAAVHGVLRQAAFSSPEVTVPRGRMRVISFWNWAVALMAVFGLTAGLWRIVEVNRMAAPVVVETHESERPVDDSKLDVLLSGSSGAIFFNDRVPTSGTRLEFKKRYALTEGLVELAFPSGASTIIEAPSLFRILNKDSLAMDTGRCSVHAPDGAEGFRVETPVTRVVDRGTRFIVNVSESTDTEVQVVEGIADVYRKSENFEADAVPNAPEVALPLEARLQHRQAQRFYGLDAIAAKPLKFAPEHYRGQLPDRVVSYQATRSAKGEAEELISVMVQREGILQEYAVDEMIPVELIGFKSNDTADRNGHLIGEEDLPERRKSLLSDRTLHTGVINPGGQRQALTSDPVMQIPEDPLHPNTKGMGIRFQSAVVNAPGPDVVLMEVQMLSGPLDGDAFHISPMIFKDGRRSLTVRKYDLT